MAFSYLCSVDLRDRFALPQEKNYGPTVEAKIARKERRERSMTEDERRETLHEP